RSRRALAGCRLVRRTPATLVPAERHGFLGASRRAALHLGNGNRRDLNGYAVANESDPPAGRRRARRRASPRRARGGVRGGAAAEGVAAQASLLAARAVPGAFPGRPEAAAALSCRECVVRSCVDSRTFSASPPVSA